MRNGIKITCKEDGGTKRQNQMVKNFNMNKIFVELWQGKITNYKVNQFKKELWLREKMTAANSFDFTI